jgi:hypothetical protein
MDITKALQLSSHYVVIAHFTHRLCAVAPFLQQGRWSAQLWLKHKINPKQMEQMYKASIDKEIVTER